MRPVPITATLLNIGEVFSPSCIMAPCRQASAMNVVSASTTASLSSWLPIVILSAFGKP